MVKVANHYKKIIMMEILKKYRLKTISWKIRKSKRRKLKKINKISIKFQMMMMKFKIIMICDDIYNFIT